MSSHPPHVVVLIGPTASGKTELAIEIADFFKTRIHNIDSRQIYKFMDIGTAKPTKNQQKKIKHFLIDIEEPINPINVKQFQEIALKSITKEINFFIDFEPFFYTSGKLNESPFKNNILKVEYLFFYIK